MPEVVDQQAVVGRRLRRLKVARHLAVQQAAARERHALVGHVLNESVAEGDRAPAVLRARGHQRRREQIVERALERYGPQERIVDAAEHLRVEGSADYRPCLEHLPRVGRQPVDARHEQALDPVRDLQGCQLGGTGE